MNEKFPRVSDILRDVGLDPDFSLVPDHILDAARERGMLVHRAIEALSYGYYEENGHEVPDVCLPYIAAYRKFITDSGAQMIAAEIEVVHGLWRYRGHPDWVGMITKHLTPVRAVLDWKTGAASWRASTMQVAAYADAWNHQYVNQPVQAAGIVELRDDGSYRFREVDINEALPHFLAAVSVYYDKREVKA